MLWGLTLLGTALLLNTFAGSTYTRRQIRKSTAQMQSEVASMMARTIQSFMERKLERLSDVGIAMSLYSLGGEEQKLLGFLLLKNDRSFTEFAILDHRGMETTKFSEREVFLAPDLQDLGGSPLFKSVAKGESYVSPVRTTAKAEPYVTMAVPLKSAPNKLVGVLVAKANLKFLWEVIGSSTFGTGGYAYLVDGQGRLVAHRDASMVLKALQLGGLAKVRQFIASRTEDRAPGEEVAGINGERVLATYAPVGNLDWAVVVEEPADLALADLAAMQFYAGVLLAIGLLIGAVIIVWVSRKITEPIQQLRAGVKIIRDGNLDHRAEIASGDEIGELAEEFNGMTEALQSSYATLEEKVEQRTREISTLYEVTSAVNESLDLDTILHSVVGKIAAIFHFECTRVFLYEPNCNLLQLRASFEVNPEYWTGVRWFKQGEGIIGQVAEAGEAMIFEDILADERYATLSSTHAAGKAQLRFFALFPIKTKSRVFGVILFNSRMPRTLSDEEKRLLTSMAAQLGVAVEKASLFEQVRARSQHLEVLNVIGAAVGQSLDLEMIFQGAVTKICQTLGFDAAWIYQLEPGGESLCMRAHVGLGDHVAASMALRSVDAGISGEVMRGGKRQVFEDLQNDPLYRELSRAGKVVALGFKTASVFPIRVKEKVIGALHAANRTRRHFAPEELQLLESIAQEIGVAVENARLFAEVSRKTAELACINQELLEATRAKSEFIAAMSHELRTPLNIIIGNASLTHEEFFGALNADQKNALRKIERNAHVLLKMVNDVLSLSRLEAKKMSLDVATVEIDEIIEHARNQVEQINRDRRLEVRWDVDESVPPLVTDALKLEEILQNLIGNAFKFTHGGYIEVRVRNLGDQDRVEFSVADTGVGIEADSLERIFKEFEQVKDGSDSHNPGVGLGLSIVKNYLELMNGDIRVESEPGRGSTFIFSVPRAVSLHS